MPQKFVYFVGGPADLTKRAIDERYFSGDMIRFAVAEPMRFNSRTEYVDTKCVAKPTIQSALYRLHRMTEGLFIGIFERMERDL